MSEPVPQYMKIRRYVVNQAMSANGKAKKILPERELCRRFNVARGTARRALEDLVKEGLLVPRRGMGTYVNPKAVRSSGETRVGMLFCNGMGVNLNSDYLDFCGGAFAVFSANKALVQILSLTFSDAERAVQEIAALGLDGVLWYRPLIDNAATVWGLLERQASPLVVMAANVAPTWRHWVLDDYVGAVTEGTKKLIETAGADTVFVGYNPRRPDVRGIYAAFEGVFAARGLARPEDFTVPADNIRKPLQRLLRERRPKALYTQGGEFGQTAIAVLREEAKCLPEGFAVLCQDTPELDTLPSQVRVARIPLPNNARLGEIAARTLIAAIADPDAAPIRATMSRNETPIREEVTK